MSLNSKLPYTPKSPKSVSLNLTYFTPPDADQFIANRQRITLPVGEGKPLPLTDDNRSLASYGVEDGATLRLKDLGRQIGYRALYLWEYVSFS